MRGDTIYDILTMGEMTLGEQKQQLLLHLSITGANYILVQNTRYRVYKKNNIRGLCIPTVLLILDAAFYQVNDKLLICINNLCCGARS